MNTPRQRTFISKHTTLTSRVRVYAMSDAIEIEERVHSLRRRRVLFDEVQLLTLHRRRPWPFITLFILFTLMTVSMVVLFFNEGETTVAYVFGGFTLFFFLASALYIARPATILTVTSRRNKEEIQFGFREGRAREWFGQLQRSVREAQSRVADEVARQNAAIRQLASMGGALPMPPSAMPAAAAPVMTPPSPAPSAPSAVPQAPGAPQPGAPQPGAPQPAIVPEAPATVTNPSEPTAVIPPPPDFMPPKG